MSILSFEARGVRLEPLPDEEMANISAPGPGIKIVKTLDDDKDVVFVVVDFLDVDVVV